MTEENIYNEYTGAWTISGNEYFVPSGSAFEFAEYITKKHIRILGIEGFEFAHDATMPNMNVIFDCSDKQPEKDELLSFITTGAKLVTHFSFVLDI